ncbi:hypothetical protein RJT34_16702 [Clitoria ternatea]|uniref:Uncharacterized protein n=1 Tax=Clitoria ternatea TaxID=43366 RepID=A0AAN9J7W0_CLITE
MFSYYLEVSEKRINVSILVLISVLVGTESAEVNILREACTSLKLKLEEEKLVLAALKQSGQMASAAAITLQLEVDKCRAARVFHEMNEKKVREMMSELPKKLQKVAQKANEAKSLAQAAQAELLEA